LSKMREAPLAPWQGRYYAFDNFQIRVLVDEEDRLLIVAGDVLDALRIIDRGDLAASEMHGAWAGEIGQTQFMPSSYIKFAVDFDGNGRRDLMRSAPDVLASTANYLSNHGWQRGKGWEPGGANFPVIQEWNKSEVYARTIAYFASQLAHAP